MQYIAITLLLVVNSLGLGLVLLQLPGIWIMVGATAGLAWWRWDEGIFTPGFLVAIVILAVVSEVLEFMAGTVGAKRAGGGRRGAMGALVGGILGAIIGTVAIPVPLFGSLIGACVGAAVGAWGLELAGGRDAEGSVRAGVGAGLGRLAGILVKLLIGAVIWVAVAVAAFWP